MRGAAADFEHLKSLPASVAILDADGTIVAVNDTWKAFGRRHGLRVPHSAIGASYLQYCTSDDPHTRRLAKQLKALLAGRLDLLTLIYPCHSPHRQRWFTLIGVPLSLDKPTGAALLHVNLTSMLPLPHGMQSPAVKADRPRRPRPAPDLSAISGAVERTVSHALSGQLDAMFAGTRQAPSREKVAAPEATDQMQMPLTQLSQRQMEVLRLLGEGKSNKEMARALLLSPNTIKLHVSAILRRLKLKSRTHAALLSSRLNERGTAVASNANGRPRKKTGATA